MTEWIAITDPQCQHLVGNVPSNFSRSVREHLVVDTDYKIEERTTTGGRKYSTYFLKEHSIRMMEILTKKQDYLAKLREMCQTHVAFEKGYLHIHKVRPNYYEVLLNPKSPKDKKLLLQKNPVDCIAMLKVHPRIKISKDGVIRATKKHILNVIEEIDRQKSN